MRRRPDPTGNKEAFDPIRTAVVMLVKARESVASAWRDDSGRHDGPTVCTARRRPYPRCSRPGS